jgi:hypothetical protein
MQVLGFEIVDTGTAFAIHGKHRKIGIVMVDLAWNEVLDNTCGKVASVLGAEG